MANFKLAARIRKLLESPPSRSHAEVKCKQNKKTSFIVQVYCRVAQRILCVYVS